MAGLLVTGFDAFAGLESNISERAVRALPHAWRGRGQLWTAVLPTVYDVAGEQVEDLIAAHAPEAVVLLGVARSRHGIQLERVALNLDDSDTADNAQRVRTGLMIDVAGPVGYWSTLPLAAMYARLREMGMPVEISNHAGTFLCNHVFFVARAAIERTNPAVPCGFVHLPDIADGEFAGLLDAVVACLEVVKGAP